MRHTRLNGWKFVKTIPLIILITTFHARSSHYRAAATGAAATGAAAAGAAATGAAFTRAASAGASAVGATASGLAAGGRVTRRSSKTIQYSFPWISELLRLVDFEPRKSTIELWVSNIDPHYRVSMHHWILFYRGKEKETQNTETNIVIIRKAWILWTW